MRLLLLMLLLSGCVVTPEKEDALQSKPLPPAANAIQKGNQNMALVVTLVLATIVGIITLAVVLTKSMDGRHKRDVLRLKQLHEEQMASLKTSYEQPSASDQRASDPYRVGRH